MSNVSSNDVWRATADEWAVYREIRLASLADAPDAFGSTLDRESAMTEELWRARFDNGAIFLGARAGEVLATAAAVPSSETEVQIVGVWTRPSARGTGLSRATVEAVLDWAGERTALLWVTEANVAAERFYTKLGFTRTGRRASLPRDDSIRQVELTNR